jgi:hypothetical protein
LGGDLVNSSSRSTPTPEAARDDACLRFVQLCGGLSIRRALLFALRLLWVRVVSVPCWIKQLRQHALETSRHCLLPDGGDQMVVAACGALTWQVADLSGGRPTPLETGLLYGGIALADRWVDVRAHDGSMRKTLADQVMAIAIEGRRPEEAQEPAGALMFAQIDLMLSLVHARSVSRPGWPRLKSALESLLSAGHREFQSSDMQAALAAAEDVGAASGLVLLQVAHLEGAAPSPEDERTAMMLGAILNILDDLLDWPEDLQSRTCTVVTAAPSVEEGEAFGYDRCVQLYRELEEQAQPRQLGAIRNVIATWWLRMSMKRRTISRHQLWQLVRA